MATVRSAIHNIDLVGPEYLDNTRMATDENFVKIRLLDTSGEGGDETLWAEPLDNGCYRIRNIPLRESLRHLDIVRCVPSELEDDFPIFTEVAERGPNRSVFLHLLVAIDDDAELGKALQSWIEQSSLCEWFTPDRLALSVAIERYEDCVASLAVLEHDKKLTVFRE